MHKVSYALACALVVLASLSIHAQDAPDSVKSKFLKESTSVVKSDSESVSRAVERERKGFFRPYGPSFKVSMSLCAGTATADILSQKHAEGKGYVEGNPLARGSDGKLNVWKAIALKAGPCALTLLGEKKHPKPMFWTRIIISGVWGAATIWNGSR